MSVHGGPDLYDLTTPLSDSQRHREDALRQEREAAALAVCRAQLAGDDLSQVLQALGLVPYDQRPALPARRQGAYDSKAYNAKLDTDSIAAMRTAREAGATLSQLAARFGVSTSTVVRHTSAAVSV